VRDNPVKQKIAQGALCLGAWMVVDHPAIATSMGSASFDYLVFDLEHGHYDYSTLLSCLNALGRSDTSPMVRIPSNDVATIKQILELGPEGLVVPMVCTAEEAERAVAASKYPPQGIRGIGGGRASGYGRDFDDYIEHANENVCIVVQIEHPRAVENIDAITQVEGVDCVFIGPADLSAGLGITMQMDHPELLDAIDRVLESGQKHGKCVGLWCRNEEHAAAMAERGFRFLAWGCDTMWFNRAVDETVAKVKALTHRQ